MRNEVSEGDGLHRPERVVDHPEFGEEFEDRIVEAEPAPVAELEEGHGGERLGDRGPVEDRPLIHRPAGFQVGVAEELPGQHRVAMKEHQAPAHHPFLGHGPVKELPDRRPGRRKAIGGPLGHRRRGREEAEPEHRTHPSRGPDPRR